MKNHLRLCSLGLLAAMWLALMWKAGEPASGQQPKTPVVRPRPAGAPAKDVPKEGELYVFQRPTVGLQTLLVLKVVDGETFEGAYLMPVRVKLEGGTGKGKPAAELDKLIGGRLVNTLLRGVDAAGNQVADVHFGAPQKDKPNDPSGWLSEWVKRPKK